MGAIASMTGYGRGEARSAQVVVTVEARSLNHRFLEIHVKTGRGLSGHEAELRRLPQGRIARGRLDLAVTTRRVAGHTSTVRTDAGLATEYVALARSLAASAGVPGELTVADLLRLPGVVGVEEAEEDEAELGRLLKAAAAAAIDALVEMRRAEGAALALELGTLVTALEAWRGDLGTLLAPALARIQARVVERIRGLLGEPPVDPGRIAQEAATWAARGDVAEELARLGSHLAQCRALLAAGGPTGRQLDFLAQELHREVNTIASKADDGEMIARLLEARTLVERFREQVQNVE